MTEIEIGKETESETGGGMRTGPMIAGEIRFHFIFVLYSVVVFIRIRRVWYCIINLSYIQYMYALGKKTIFYNCDNNNKLQEISVF